MCILDTLSCLYYYTGMKELIDNINVQIEVFEKNSNLQLVNGNKGAGARARKASLELGKLMKEFRKVSLELSKN